MTQQEFTTALVVLIPDVQAYFLDKGLLWEAATYIALMGWLTQAPENKLTMAIRPHITNYLYYQDFKFDPEADVPGQYL